MRRGIQRIGRRLVVASVLAATAPAGLALAADGSTGLGFRALLGARPVDPEKMADWPVAALTRAYLPEAIDLTPMMPPPVQQMHGSCVSYSVAYATRGYYSAIAAKAKPGSEKTTPSPAFLHTQIYNQEEPCTEGGADSVDAVKFLIKNGVPDFETVPEAAICSASIAGSRPAVNGFSVRGGTKIFAGRPGGPRPNRAVIDKMKQSLATGDPVVVQFRLFNTEAPRDVTLALVKPDEIYRGSLAKHADFAGNHAMVFVGYDDRRQAFRVQNSWSEAWADGGFGWIGYDAVVADMTSALTMATSVTPPKPKPARPKLLDHRPLISDGCSLVVTSHGSKGRRASGFVETPEELSALTFDPSVSSVEDVSIRPWPICEALLTLREPLAAPSRPKVEFLRGTGEFRIGDPMGFKVTTPNFPSFLYVVYLQSDGTVVNLVPRGGPMRRQTPAGATLVFGDGRDGRQTFRAAEPIGSEAIVAIAARSPLAALEELEKAGGQFRLSAAARRDDGQGVEDEPKAADPTSAGPKADDRLYLSVLRAAMAENPQTEELARETTADVAYVSIAKK